LSDEDDVRGKTQLYARALEVLPRPSPDVRLQLREQRQRIEALEAQARALDTRVLRNEKLLSDLQMEMREQFRQVLAALKEITVWVKTAPKSEPSR
jgi:hypothetical protein